MEPMARGALMAEGSWDDSGEPSVCGLGSGCCFGSPVFFHVARAGAGMFRLTPTLCPWAETAGQLGAGGSMLAWASSQYGGQMVRFLTW